MITDPTDGKLGLRIESAASVVIRETLFKFFATFNHVIIADRAAGKSVHAEYVNGLAGVTALLIAARHGSKEEVIEGTIAKLREYVDRDLRHLGRSA